MRGNPSRPAFAKERDERARPVAFRSTDHCRDRSEWSRLGSSRPRLPACRTTIMAFTAGQATQRASTSLFRGVSPPARIPPSAVTTTLLSRSAIRPLHASGEKPPKKQPNVSRQSVRERASQWSLPEPSADRLSPGRHAPPRARAELPTMVWRLCPNGGEGRPGRTCAPLNGDQHSTE